MEDSSIDDLDVPVDSNSVGSKWAIGTYLRVRPPGPEDTDLIQYKIQGSIMSIDHAFEYPNNGEILCNYYRCKRCR